MVWLHVGKTRTGWLVPGLQRDLCPFAWSDWGNVRLQGVHHWLTVNVASVRALDPTAIRSPPTATRSPPVIRGWSARARRETPGFNLLSYAVTELRMPMLK
eukprot:CAMPEP_0180695420 /NCGR_PEP_ID=MMETSP1038_2-20121128/2434_1 /TAXON_ID=632150 /ORGANISM="Azadinium spinosum, Strain 3D9" /LENGTH=100 /DNA_ID=CAMNT_0022726827 /DNA_START=387 /DNA_END=686 /DNA_ORIENTATION=-